jgi:Glycoside-hydrolase family GH114
VGRKRLVAIPAAVAVVLSLAGFTASDGMPPSAAAAVPRVAAAYPAGTALSGPTAQGHLRIAGDLRDGGTVRATGLYWRTSLLPAKDRVLTFAISYTWQSCSSTCVAASDSTATPFAAQRYIVGHADTGRRLRLTETASEVVETDPATFAFTRVSASVSVTTESVVRAYHAGRAPVTEFVNGTPEQRTASNAEYFQVDAPHYSAADGVPVQRYRVDGGRWRVLARTRLFYTGKLRVGPHQVQVRTANSAGATTLSFGWRVVPMPRPVACRPWHGKPCWYPQHLAANGKPMRWDWQIGRVAPLQRTGRRAVDIYDIDGFLTTAAQVRALHTRWQAATLPHPKAICYLDMAWEDYRPDASPGLVFPADTLGKVYYGYPQERWVDFRQLDALKPMLTERIAMCARKGFDAVELDDIDSFDPPSTTGFHLTPGDAQNFLAFAFNEIHRYGMTGLWKNSPYLSWWGRRYADGAIVEECYFYRQCFASQLRGSSQYGIRCTALTGRTPCGWNDFSTDRARRQPTGKWVGEAEYSADHYVCNPGQSCAYRRRFSSFCRAVWAPSDGFAAVKFDVDLNGAMFYPCPRGT